MNKHYIEKTFPITLHDLIELAKSQNLDPKDLKLIINDSNPNYTDYVKCALLNQDTNSISIELYHSINLAYLDK